MSVITTRYCYLCKLSLPDEEFTIAERRFHGGRSVGRCRTCVSAMNREYRAKNGDRMRAQNRVYRQSAEYREWERKRSYKRRYGISVELYEQMRVDQKFRCALCNRHETEQQSRWGVLCLDHDHKTGRVRKLLCARCNKGLGCLNDDVSLLERAAKYIQTFQSAEKIQGAQSNH